MQKIYCWILRIVNFFVMSFCFSEDISGIVKQILTMASDENDILSAIVDSHGLKYELQVRSILVEILF